MTATRDTTHPPEGHPLGILQDCTWLRRALADQQRATAATLERQVLPLLRATLEAVSTGAANRFGPEYRGAFAAEAGRLRDVAGRIQAVLDVYRAEFPDDESAGR